MGEPAAIWYLAGVVIIMFSWISSFLSTGCSQMVSSDTSSINPASGLPMIGAIDIGGNPFGTDLHSSSGCSFSSFDSFSTGIDACGGSTSGIGHDW